MKEKIIIWFIRRWLRRNEDKEGVKAMIFILTRIFWCAAYLVKNISVILGIVEQVIKLLASLAHLTKTTRDDEWMDKVEKWFDNTQGKIYETAYSVTAWYQNIFKK